MSEQSDLIDVVDRAALVENILNQVIEDFCRPRSAPPMFFWNVILDSSIMPMGSKVKVAAAIAQELKFELEQDALHKVMALRNAFAHHKTSSHPVISIGKSEEDTTIHYELQVLSNSGRLSRKRRVEALEEFNAAYRIARDSLVALQEAIKTRLAQ